MDYEQLGALYPGKRFDTAARKASSMGKERQDVTAAHDAIAALNDQMAQLEADFKDAITPLLGSPAPRLFEVVQVPVAPRKADIQIEFDE